jgi:hypothetical protein
VLTEHSRVLWQREVQVIIENAMLTRERPDSIERTEEASRRVRMAMYYSALGQITQEEKKRILDILRPCCPEIFFTSPLIDDRPSTFSPTEDDEDGHSLPARVDA